MDKENAKKWITLFISPKSARQLEFTYDNHRCDAVFILISVACRYIYVLVQYQRLYLPSLFLAVLSSTLTVYLSAWALEKIIIKYSGVTLSEIASYIWSVQTVTGIFLIIICFYGGQIKLSIRLGLRIIESIMIVRYLWRYQLIHAEISILSGTIYLVIASFYIL